MDDTARKFNIEGSLSVITGANAGIGKETARKLSRLGSHVIMACRSVERAAAARDEIQAFSGNPVDILQVDMSSFESIRRFCDQLSDRFGAPDILINNAAVYTRKHMMSPDGFEMTVAVNYLGPFLLTGLLLPRMMEINGETRIINVTSGAYKAMPFRHDLALKKKMKGFRAYSLSKRALMYFTFELSERVRDTGVTVNCVNPGHSITGIWPSSSPVWIIARKIISVFSDPPSYAAENVVHAASSGALTGITGKYISGMDIIQTDSKDFIPNIQKDLWEYTIKLIEEGSR